MVRRNRTCALSWQLLAPDSIAIAIKMGTIARLSTSHRRSACGSGC